MCKTDMCKKAFWILKRAVDLKSQHEEGRRPPGTKRCQDAQKGAIRKI